jgi:hypothetical protein
MTFYVYSPEGRVFYKKLFQWLERQAYLSAWNKTEKGRARIKKYHLTEKGKAARKRYRQSEKGVVKQKESDASEGRKAWKRVWEGTSGRRAYLSTYHTSRYAEDFGYRITRNLRNRLWGGFKKQGLLKVGSAFDLTGCSSLELQQWLLFRSAWTAPGATLDNYGEWQIGHIIPCAEWDLRCPLQQSLCFHYTNLQPLWVEDHRKKSLEDTKRILNYGNG